MLRALSVPISLVSALDRQPTPLYGGKKVVELGRLEPLAYPAGLLIYNELKLRINLEVVWPIRIELVDLRLAVSKVYSLG